MQKTPQEAPEKRPTASYTVQVHGIYSPVTLWNIAHHLEKRHNLNFVRADVLRCQFQAMGDQAWLEAGGLEDALKQLGVHSNADTTQQRPTAQCAACSARRYKHFRLASALLGLLLCVCAFQYLLPTANRLTHLHFTAITAVLNGALLGLALRTCLPSLRVELHCRLQERLPLPGTAGYTVLMFSGVFGFYYFYWTYPVPLYVESVGVLCWLLVLADFLMERRRHRLLLALDGDGFGSPGRLSESAILAERDPLGPLQLNYSLARLGAIACAWLGWLTALWWWQYPAAFTTIAAWGQPYLPAPESWPSLAVGCWMALGIWMIGLLLPHIALFSTIMTEMMQRRALQYHTRLPSDCHIPLLFKMRSLCFFRHRIFTTDATRNSDYVGLDDLTALDALALARAVAATADSAQGEDRDIQTALRHGAERERAPARSLEAWDHLPGLAYIAHNEEEGFLLARGSYLEHLGISLDAVKHPRYAHQQAGKTVLFLARGGHWDKYSAALRDMARMTVVGYVTFSHTIRQEVIPSLRILKRLQVATRLLSPDDPERAKILAQQVGIPSYQGKQLPNALAQTMKQLNSNTVGALGLAVHREETPPVIAPADLRICVAEDNDLSPPSSAESPRDHAEASHPATMPIYITRGGLASLIPTILLIRAGQLAALRGLCFFLCVVLVGIAAAFLGALHPLLALGWALGAQGILFLHTRYITRFDPDRSLEDVMTD